MAGIFISYAHIDNEPLVDGEAGWISSLHKVLEKRLAMLLGERPQIWRDRELRGHDFFDQTIAEAIENASIFVTILTPRYVRSDYCKKELETFFAARELKVGDKSRVFKVIKTPIEIGEHPEPIRQLLGYEFFQVEEERRRLRELSLDAPDPGFRARFLMVADDLAQDIGALIRLADPPPERARAGAPAAAAAPSSSSGRTVYLAATTADLKEAHDGLRRELATEGHRVLPAAVLPLENDAFSAAVQQDLAEAVLSIHLIGGRYGFVPEDAGASNVELQLGFAGQRPRLPRLIWMPPEVAASDPRQQELIARLRSDPAAQQGAALLQASLEELKAEIRRRLAPAPPPAVAPADGEDEAGPRWIYLIHDPRDLEAIGPLEDHLWNSGFEVKKPLSDGDETELREEHEENLRLCDAFLIYFGEGNERWLSKNLGDLKKARGLGREKPILAKGIYLAPPGGPAKARYRTLEATVIQGGEAFAPEQLAVFLQPFAGRGSGA